MSSKTLAIAAMSMFALTAAFAPTAVGEATENGVTFYLAPGSATKGKLLLEVPTATEAGKVTKNGPRTSTTHEWEAGARPANLTVTGNPVVTIFVEPGSGVAPTGNPPNQLPGSLYLRVSAKFGSATSTVKTETVPTGAGAKEVTAELTFTGYPLAVAPDATIVLTTEFYALQATGAQVTYHVNATTTLSRIEIPGNIEGLLPPVTVQDDNETVNETVEGNTTGNGTGNASGNDPDAAKTNTSAKKQAAGDKKKESGLPGFGAAAVALAGAMVALARRRHFRG